MELGVRFRGGEAVLGEDARIVQVDRLVEGSARGVGIDHLDVLADGSRPEILFPGDADRDLADAGGVELSRKAGIESEDPQVAQDGFGNQVTLRHESPFH